MIKKTKPKNVCAYNSDNRQSAVYSSLCVLMNDLFNRMESWYRENERLLKASGLKPTLSEISENTKPARYLDIESASKLGRLTVWVSGEAEIQIQNFNSNESESMLVLVVRNPKELTEALSRLIKSVEPKYA